MHKPRESVTESFHLDFHAWERDQVTGSKWKRRLKPFVIQEKSPAGRTYLSDDHGQTLRFFTRRGANREAGRIEEWFAQTAQRFPVAGVGFFSWRAVKR
jgi:hypothetical protein